MTYQQRTRNQSCAMARCGRGLRQHALHQYSANTILMHLQLCMQPTMILYLATLPTQWLGNCAYTSTAAAVHASTEAGNDGLQVQPNHPTVAAPIGCCCSRCRCIRCLQRERQQRLQQQPVLKSHTVVSPFGSSSSYNSSSCAISYWPHASVNPTSQICVSPTCCTCSQPATRNRCVLLPLLGCLLLLLLAFLLLRQLFLHTC